MKKNNITDILETIMKHKTITTSIIAKKTHLSLATISRTLKLLQEWGIVVEDGKEDSIAGRKTQLFTLNRYYKYVVGVVIDKTEVVISLADLRGEILRSRTISMRFLGMGVEILDNISKQIVHLVQEFFQTDSALSWIEVIGIGVSGIIDKKKETVVNAAHIPGWKNLEIVKYMEEKLKIKTYVDSTNHISIMGCKDSFPFDNISNLVYLTIGTGIGMGIMINNKLYYGTHGTAGEIRNMIVSHLNPLGINRFSSVQNENLSFLEEHYGTQKIVQEAIHYLKKSPNSILWEIVSKTGTEYEDISNMDMIVFIDQAAQIGDEGCIHLLYEPVRIWASIVINIICCFDPGVVIIGGGDVHEGTPYILRLLREIVYQTLEFSIEIVGDEPGRVKTKAAIEHTLSYAYTRIVNSMNQDGIAIPNN